MIVNYANFDEMSLTGISHALSACCNTPACHLRGYCSKLTNWSLNRTDSGRKARLDTCCFQHTVKKSRLPGSMDHGCRRTNCRSSHGQISRRPVAEKGYTIYLELMHTVYSGSRTIDRFAEIEGPRRLSELHHASYSSNGSPPGLTDVRRVLFLFLRRSSSSAGRELAAAAAVAMVFSRPAAIISHSPAKR